MNLPPHISAKFLSRFTLLIEEGEAIQKAVKTIPGEYYEDFTGRSHRRPSSQQMDWERVVKWKTNCASLMDQIIPSKSIHRSSIETLHGINQPGQLAWAVNTIKALEDDFKNGFLGDLSTMIESAIASDYMGQAEGLLSEGQKGKYDHVPAAVLVGAVLEKALRSLCDKQEPDISLQKANGEPKTLNLLIDDLKKAGCFNEAKAKQLRGWAAIRNHAAHGEFDQFTRSDVEQLLQGVNNFLADYL